MESVFVKNMPEAIVNRTNKQKTKKTKKQNPEGNVSARVSSEFPQGFVFFVFLLFLVFLFFLFFFKLCKKLSGRTLGRQKDAKSRSWGGRAYIYIYIL